MTKSLIFFFLLLTKIANSQTKIYEFKEVGWKIEIPSELSIKDSSSITKNGTVKSINGFDQNGNSVTFYTFQFDNNFDSSFAELIRNMKQIMYLSQLPSTNKNKIDTTSSIEKIDGLKFKKFQSKLIGHDNYESVLLLYTGIIKNYGLMIQIIYYDKETGKKLIKTATTSRFETR